MKKTLDDPKEASIRDELCIQAMHFVRAARSSTGLSQRRFARKAGVAANTVAQIEANASPHPPRLPTLLKIARGAGKRLVLTLESQP